jgi:hypothetical protein
MADNKEIRVGDELPFWCSNCNLNLWGNVAAMDGPDVVQVSCRTCRSTVIYRPEKSDLELRRRTLQKVFSIRDRRKQRWNETGPVVKAGTKEDVTKRWREATEGIDSRYAPMYAPEKGFEEGDTLIHPEHGFGIVAKVLHENAALVLFRLAEVPVEMNVTSQE